MAVSSVAGVEAACVCDCFPATMAKSTSPKLVSNIPSGLLCSACGELLKEPIQTICGERFCQECFKAIVKYVRHLYVMIALEKIDNALVTAMLINCGWRPETCYLNVTLLMSAYLLTFLPSPTSPGMVTHSLDRFWQGANIVYWQRANFPSLRTILCLFCRGNDDPACPVCRETIDKKRVSDSLNDSTIRSCPQHNLIRCFVCNYSSGQTRSLPTNYANLLCIV